MARKRKVQQAPPVRQMMVLSKKLPLGEIPEGLDPTRHEVYKSGFCCPSCGSLNASSHSYECQAASYAVEAGVSLIEYAKDPSLWCPVISGYEDERVRCVKNGKPQHEGLHGFPTYSTCLQAQKVLGAVDAAVRQEQSKPKVQYIPQEEEEMAKASKTEKTNGKKGTKGGNPAALKKAQEANEGKRAELHAKKIHMLTKDNPKREGTEAYKRFQKYKNGMTVAEALESGITMSDIRYNEEHGHLELK